MNKEIRKLFDKENIHPQKITIKNNIRIIETKQKKLVIKKENQDLETLYRYLYSRSFDYFPKTLYRTDHYIIYNYIEDIPISKEEKAEDIIKLLTLLHSKTTFYKEIDDDTYKKIYENIIDRLNYLKNYYQDIAEVIEREEYMSPSHYLLIRNITKLFQALEFCHNQIELWYKNIEEKKRIRVAQIHNHLKLEHYLFEDKPYFISWQRSKRDIPVYDLAKFYQQYYQEFDFCNLLRKYELHYPMLPEEKNLFLCLISIPEKIELDTTEVYLCKRVKKFYTYIFTTEKLIKDYFQETSLPKREK